MRRLIQLLIRVPVFLAMWLIGFFGIFFVVGSTTLGAWCEGILAVLGYRGKSLILPRIVGVIIFCGVVVIGPAYVGSRYLGWPGGVLGPILVLGLIAVAGRW